MIKKLILSVKRGEWWLFGLMFAIVSLININFNILRSARNALVVASEGGSAALIPYYELFGTFPASILMTWGISRLMRKYSFRSIFSMSMGFFLTFFIFFAFWIHPHRELVQSLFGHHSPDLIFYILSELWKVALLSVIFWGFINQHLSMDVAKRFYPPLMLGSSVGAILAGPITVFCTSEYTFEWLHLSHERWQHSLYLLTTSMVLCGLFTFLAFNLLHKHLGKNPAQTEEEEKVPFKRKLLSLSSSLQYLFRSRYLLALLFIVLAEYVSYALGELIFLETLKEMFPTRVDYCQYLGNLTFWTGILTAFCAIILTPYLLHKFRWSYSALLTPVLMVLLTFAFFAAIYMGKMGLLPPGVSPLPFIVFLGSLHFCIGRSIKYTVFDTTKELAFIPLSQEGQMKGKLVIDGIGSRLGRGTSSLISIGLFAMVGAPGESAIFAGVIATCFALLSIPAARVISGQLEGVQSK